MPTEFLSPGLTIALTAYAIGVASPGPSNMAIMATAMSQGRQYALALAAGVVCGSVAWGLACRIRAILSDKNLFMVVGRTQTAYVSDGQANQALGVRFIFRNVDILM